MATPTSTITRNMTDLDKQTGNIYEAIAIVAKRSNQISASLKEELNAKLEEFAIPADAAEEVFENREQIEISKYYERLPKPTLTAMEEFINEKVYHRNQSKEA